MIVEDMKKQYTKPQIKTVAVRSMGLLLAGSYNDIDTTSKRRTNVLGSRDGNFFDDDEEEIEDSMWK